MGVLLAAPATLLAQGAATPVSPDTLRANLFAIADDSMGGRNTGSPGNVRTADWVAAMFVRYGLTAAGENGTYFQTVPLWRAALDTTTGLEVDGVRLTSGRDVLPAGVLMSWTAGGAATIYGGAADDSTTWPTAEQIAGKLVVLRPPAGGGWTALTRAALALRREARFRAAAGFAVAGLDSAPPGLAEQAMTVCVWSSAPRLDTGPTVNGSVAFKRTPLHDPARNVIAILPGSDPALRESYVSLSAHNDHVGLARPAVDHDSTRAFNRVVRPMGADSPLRPATPGEAARIATLRDSLRAAHPVKRDSVYNGADDDGSGTVALVELARVLASGRHPRRSILFISHAAEERGLLGSRWFTDHPTVPLDSIMAELDMDMIGRGDATDLPHGGPGYLELVGSRRLSTEFGDLIEAVAGREPQPFHFNYEYDAPGHPLQYYCRADHYSYARLGIPSVSLSTGEHLDYHQVTDEPQYINYTQLARVTSLVRDVAVAVANLDHRPVVDGPRQDPRAPCRQ